VKIEVSEMHSKENFKTWSYLDFTVALKCDKCNSLNAVFLRSEPVFEDSLGMRQSKLREIYECRNCGSEISVDKEIEAEESPF
jgi:hypothetical protein